jgi:hypothetical protein
MSMGNSFFWEPFVNFPVAYYGGGGARGYGLTVENMVGMTVRKQDEVWLYFLNFDVRSEFIATDEWVKQQTGVVEFELEAGVSEIGEFHSVCIVF